MNNNKDKPITSHRKRDLEPNTNNELKTACEMCGEPAWVGNHLQADTRRIRPRKTLCTKSRRVCPRCARSREYREKLLADLDGLLDELERLCPPIAKKPS